VRFKINIHCTWKPNLTKPPDYEIFRVRDEVASSEGPDITFYNFIGVSSSASQIEIQRAYRKKSKQIHPDKARQAYLATYAKPTAQPKPGTNKPKNKKPGVTVRKHPSQRELDKFTQEADKRFQLLSVAADILQTPERRDRYDYFLRNGFPKWRGTGYYYQRFRPGIGSVLVGLLVVVGGLAHYGAMYLSWKRQRDFVERYVRHARQMAWGNGVGIQGIPGVDAEATATPPNEVNADVNEDGAAMNWNRRQKRQQEKENRKAAKNPKAVKAAKTSGISTPVEAELTSGPTGAKKRVVAENGKVLIVDSVGNVYLEEETDDGQIHEYLLDVRLAHLTHPPLTNSPQLI